MAKDIIIQDKAPEEKPIVDIPIVVTPPDPSEEVDSWQNEGGAN